MKSEMKCKYLGEFIGAADALLEWPLYSCDVPQDGPVPSMSGNAHNEDGSKTPFCRVAGNVEAQLKCTGYKEGEEAFKVQTFEERTR